MMNTAKPENGRLLRVEVDNDDQSNSEFTNPWSDMDRDSRFTVAERIADKAAARVADKNIAPAEPKDRIRHLNTRLRKTGLGGMTVVTAGVMGLPAETKVKCLELLRRDYSTDLRNLDNDPFDEYDFGTIEHEGHLLFWKIDYYDLDMMHHSSDPADENVTKRVLTVMLASEY